MSEDRGPGRPEAVIDWDNVAEWLASGAKGNECSARLGISYDTLSRRCQSDNNVDFSYFMQQNRSKGDLTLREAQIKKALSGDSTMLIWLGKVRLDQKEAKDEVKIDPKTIEFLEKFNAYLDSSRKSCDNTSIKE